MSYLKSHLYFRKKFLNVHWKIIKYLIKKKMLPLLNGWLLLNFSHSKITGSWKWQKNLPYLIKARRYSKYLNNLQRYIFLIKQKQKINSKWNITDESEIHISFLCEFILKNIFIESWYSLIYMFSLFVIVV